MITGFCDPDNEYVFDAEAGTVRQSDFTNALGLWVNCQEREPTVSEAAMTFNASPDLIRDAVGDDPWLNIVGDKIEADGA